jgi:hypothetical protein
MSVPNGARLIQKQLQKLAIAGGELVACEIGPRDPSKGRRRVAQRSDKRPARDEMKLDLAVIILFDVHGIAKERLDSDAGFFQTLTSRCRFGRFAWLDFSARKLPQARQWNTRRTLTNQELVLVLDDGNGDRNGHSS